MEGLSHASANGYCTFNVTAEEAARACRALGMVHHPSTMSFSVDCSREAAVTGPLERSFTLPFDRYGEAFQPPLESLRVSVALPRTPRTSCAGLPELPPSYPLEPELHFADVSAVSAGAVEVTVGFPPSAALHVLLPLALLLLLPCVPLLRLGRRRHDGALHLHDVAPWLPWYVHGTVPAVWILWLALVSLLQIDQQVTLFRGGSGISQWEVRVAVLALPPLVATCLASLVADRTVGRLVGSPISFATHLAAFALPACALLPFLAFVVLPPTSAWVALAAGLLGYLVAMMVWTGGVDVRRYAVLDGPLARCAEALAADHGMRAPSILVVPAADALRLRAAIARSGRLVLADSLVARLAPDELEALLALEMVRRRGAFLRAVVTILAAAPAFSCLPPLLMAVSVPLDLAVRLFLLILVADGVSRIITFRELRKTVELLGSPEPLGRAFVQLLAADARSISWYPWDRRIFGLPTLARQAAALLEAPVPVPSLPPLPARAARERILDSTFRRRAVLGALGRTLLFILAPLLAAALLVQPGRPGARHAAACLSLGAASALVAVTLAPLFPTPGFLRALGRLRRRLALEGLDDAAASFAGLSPGTQLRIHEGFYEMDFGLLHLSRERLAFAGELARFSLNRDEVVRLRQEPGSVALLPRSRIHVDWRGRAASSGTFHLRGNRRLHAAVVRWHRGEHDGAHDLPGGVAQLGPPDFPAESGEPHPPVRALVAAVPAIGVVFSLAALVAGLPWAPGAPGSIGYVGLLGTLAFGLQMLPTLRQARAEARRQWGLP